MTDDASEKRLAEALARILDSQAESGGSGAAPAPARVPELASELETLAAIDRILEPAPDLPERLSGHRIVSEIGAGGMGRVLLADDEALGRKVAVKVLAPRYADSHALRTRFMGEARAMARLSHPNIVRIYSLGPSDEPAHFVMEFVEGAPLVEAARALTFAQKAELARKIALAAHFLHERGIVHRDLKPGNILVGPDLEPKLLDFGLALDLGERERLSAFGEIAGTPDYLSPEQASGVREIDPRSDIFALGAILYELLAGEPPFRAESPAELLRRIREDDPQLPRRRNPAVPGDLQNICLKALEKDRARRYASAREMADDLRRYLAGEAVLAEPAAYARAIAGKVGQHLAELDVLRRDQVISQEELDGFRKRYRRLLEREDAWILEARRLTLPQVSLYLGAWVLAVAAAFLAFFRYPALAGAPAALIAWASAVPTAWLGIRDWKRGYYRVAIAYLLALCLLVPIAVLVTAQEAHAFAAVTMGQPRLELFQRLEMPKDATNAQLWWALLAALPVALRLRRFTRTPVFTLAFAVFGALLYLATLLRMGLLDWIDNDPGRAYLHLIPCAVLFLALGYAIERARLPDDSRYVYPIGVAFAWMALTGFVVYYEPYQRWLRSTFPWTKGQLEYLFIGNAALYFALDAVFGLSKAQQLRNVGKAFRFVIPGHVMTSLLLLGINAESRFEERFFEWLLPAVALGFVFASIPRQMKNFFASGLFFFAAGVFRLQQRVFENHSGWPIALLLAGIALMLAAANYSPLKVALRRLARRKEI